MGCECASLRLEMSSQKSEILSQRSLMVQWFETLMAELQDVKKQNSELKQLFKAFNIHQESMALSSEGSNGESAGHFSECQPESSHKSANSFLMSVEVAPNLTDEKLLAETGFQLTEDDQKIFPPEIDPSEDNRKSPLNPESINLERFESPVDTMETSSAFTDEDTSKRTRSKRPEPVHFVREKTARRPGNASKRNKTSTRNDGKFRCSECSYKTVYSISFKRHSLIHTGEKPFSCDLCDFRCRNSSNLVRHKLIHTEKKPFQCAMCKKSFARKTQLVNHNLSHTGEKPFSCDLCDYRCRSTRDLLRHNLTHTREKPFECDQCSYRATQKPYLIAHRRIHTGEKPFACDLCDFRATHKYSLVYHKKHKHKLN